MPSVPTKVRLKVTNMYDLAFLCVCLRAGVRLCAVPILDLKTASHFFPTTAHVRTVCRNAPRTAMRGAHGTTLAKLKTAAEHHIQTV